VEYPGFGEAVAKEATMIAQWAGEAFKSDPEKEFERREATKRKWAEEWGSSQKPAADASVLSPMPPRRWSKKTRVPARSPSPVMPAKSPSPAKQIKEEPFSPLTKQQLFHGVVDVSDDEALAPAESSKAGCPCPASTDNKETDFEQDK
jgi:hypothetical protein